MVLYARDIFEKDFVSLSRDTYAIDAARIMKERKHGFLIVVTSDGTPQGIVTEWDYLSKIVAEGKDPAKVTLAEIMSENLITVKVGDGIDSIAKLMAERGIRRVLVLEKGKVMGIITSKTILAKLEDYVKRISVQIARQHSPPY